LADLAERQWRLKATLARTLPVPVRRSRFLAALLVFILGIFRRPFRRIVTIPGAEACPYKPRPPNGSGVYKGGAADLQASPASSFAKRLARYMAASAFRRSSSSLRPSIGKKAMPIET